MKNGGSVGARVGRRSLSLLEKNGVKRPCSANLANGEQINLVARASDFLTWAFPLPGRDYPRLTHPQLAAAAHLDRTQDQNGPDRGSNMECAGQRRSRVSHLVCRADRRPSEVGLFVLPCRPLFTNDHWLDGGHSAENGPLRHWGK